MRPNLERRRLALELRRQGLTFAEVGKRLGTSKQGAQHPVRAAEGHRRK